jgi:hypothetical protein
MIERILAVRRHDCPVRKVYVTPKGSLRRCRCTLRDPRPVVFFAVDDLPPSAKRVLRSLAENGPLTHKDLIAATRLPPRTLRFALARLRSSGRVVWRWSLQDARQRVYASAIEG